MMISGSTALGRAWRLASSVTLILAISADRVSADDGSGLLVEEPLVIRLGGSCEELKSRYVTETVSDENGTETLAVVGPDRVFPGAWKIVASCSGEIYSALVVIAEYPQHPKSGPAGVLSQLRQNFEREHECPPISSEPMTCAIFQQKNVYVVFTGLASEPNEFSLVYGYAPDPGAVEARIRTLQAPE